MTSKTATEGKHNGFMIVVRLKDLADKDKTSQKIYDLMDEICQNRNGGAKNNLWASMIHGRCMTALDIVLTGDHMHIGLLLKKSQMRVSTLAKKFSKIGVTAEITVWRKKEINNLWAYTIDHGTTTALSKQHFSEFEKKYNVHGNFDVLAEIAKISPKIEKNLSDAERLLKRFSNRDITYDEFKDQTTTYDRLKLFKKIQKVINIHNYQDAEKFKIEHKFKPIENAILAGNRLDKDLIARQIAKSKGYTYSYATYDVDFFNEYHGEQALIVTLPSEDFLRIDENRDSQKLRKIKTMLTKMLTDPNNHDYCYNAPYGRKVYLMIDMVIFIVDTPIEQYEDFNKIAPPLDKSFKKIQNIYQTTEDYSKLEKQIGYGTVHYLEKEANKKDQRPIDQILNQWDDGHYTIHANRQSDDDAE